MSATQICPLCSGSGFRSTDGGLAHQICECIDLGDDEDFTDKMFPNRTPPSPEAFDEMRKIAKAATDRETIQQTIFRTMFDALFAHSYGQILEDSGLGTDADFCGHLFAASEIASRKFQKLKGEL
jgi:hypothetical protein